MLGIRAPRGLALVMVIVCFAIVVIARQRRASATPLVLLTPSFAFPAPPPRPAPQPDDWRTTRTLATPRGAAITVRTPDEGAPWTTAVTMLHGMCSDAQATCDTLTPGLGDLGLVVCPHGNGDCGGWADWRGSGAEKAAHLDEAFEAIEAHYGQAASPRQNGILVGFSRGAFVARDVLAERPGAFRGAILVGAAFVPDVERFRRSGVRAVVLASGEHDGARKMMQSAALRLQAGGVRAKFVTLGPIWHALPDRFDLFVRDAIAWIDGGESA